MTHTIISKPNIGGQKIIVVQLNPDNDKEKNAIKNVASFKATDQERDIVDNYLLFNIKLAGYSVINAKPRGNMVFQLELLRSS
jgi:hypothetical protein